MVDYLKAVEALVSIIDVIRFGISQARAHPLYYGHGTDNAVDDMYALVLGSLSLPLDLDERLFNATLTAEEKCYLARQLQQRIQARVPVPYLVQKAYFCDLEFYVDERVLIPRSPLAEFIQHQGSPWVAPDKVTRILDLCTGSGCIAIACCYAFPNALVDAVDISPSALEVLAINRERHQVQEQLTAIQSDCFDALSPRCYDIILSNPPYVGAEEMSSLPPEYGHEPTMALEAGQQGLAVVDNILHSALPFLSEDGILVVEVGNTEDALTKAYPNVPFTWLEFERGGSGVFLLTHEQLQFYFGPTMS